MPRRVWFRLVDSTTRGVYADTTADSLRLPEDAEHIADLRDAVFTKVSRALPARLIAANLVLYANKTAFELGDAPLAARDKIGAELGTDEEIYVAVPAHVANSVAHAAVGKANQHWSRNADGFYLPSLWQLLSSIFVAETVPQEKKDL